MWQMNFNVGKFKVMRIGTKIPSFKYMLIESEVLRLVEKRKLRVTAVSSMKISMQHSAAVKMANTMLGIMRKGAENKTATITIPLTRSKAFLLKQAYKPIMFI